MNLTERLHLEVRRLIRGDGGDPDAHSELCDLVLFDRTGRRDLIRACCCHRIALDLVEGRATSTLRSRAQPWFVVDVALRASWASSQVQLCPHGLAKIGRRVDCVACFCALPPLKWIPESSELMEGRHG